MSSNRSTYSYSRNYKPQILFATQNYRIGNELGSGCFSNVFFAQHNPTQTFVALKQIQLNGLDEKHFKCCIKEVELLNRVKSENVVKCYEWFFEESFLYISLEFADKTDLEKRIKLMQKHGRLFSERTIWFLFHQICNGVKDLHSARILHRDLKPANIFLNSKGQIKIGDLGLSRLFSANTQIAKTQISTEYYKAPERTNTFYGYNFKSDIWSLGCLLYELCALRSPFNGEAFLTRV
uniref:non-specific serine/threonine protein kinase n=1 Tax=Panagrolaimus davidi TaxID=227884 RepID=A0A914P9Y1_9BILA